MSTSSRSPLFVTALALQSQVSVCYDSDTIPTLTILGHPDTVSVGGPVALSLDFFQYDIPRFPIGLARHVIWTKGEDGIDQVFIHEIEASLRPAVSHALIALMSDDRLIEEVGAAIEASGEMRDKNDLPEWRALCLPYGMIVLRKAEIVMADRHDPEAFGALVDALVCNTTVIVAQDVPAHARTEALRGLGRLATEMIMDQVRAATFPDTFPLSMQALISVSAPK